MALSRRHITNIAAALLTACVISSMAYAQEFRFTSADHLCEITGMSAEEATLLRMLKSSLNKDLVHLSGAYALCSTIEEMKSGKTKYLIPLYTLQVAKTEGKILPMYSVTYDNLKETLEKDLAKYPWRDDQKRAVAAFQHLLDERQSAVELDMRALPPVIVDSSDRTVSIAQSTSVDIDGQKLDMTAIATTTLVDGYMVAVTITDRIENPKDFWRVQLESELLARAIKVRAAGPSESGTLSANAGIHQWQQILHSDNSRIIAVKSEEENTKYGTKSTAYFIIRCQNNTTSMYIFLDGGRVYVPSGPVQVVASIDGRSSTQKWFPSAERMHVGKWSGTESIPFIKRLISKKKLDIQIYPPAPPANSFNKSLPLLDKPVSLFQKSVSPWDVPYSFNISGINEEIGPIRKQCNW